MSNDLVLCLFAFLMKNSKITRVADEYRFMVEVQVALK